MKKNGKFFLVYTIILFSVAFVLILFSSISGLRYKDAQDEKNKLFKGAQDSVVKLTEKNEDLENDNAEKAKQIETLTAEKKKAISDLELAKEKSETALKNEDMISQVQNLYNKRDYSGAKEIFEQIDATVLGENSKLLYENLKNKLY